MDILYFGTVCNPDNFNKILEDCTQKPTVATVVFENALLEGFQQNGAKVEIHCFPMIPPYPKYKHLHFGKNSEVLPCGYTCRWLNTINIPVLKQLSRRCDGKKVLRKWVKKHKNNGLIFTYSIPPFLVKDILKYAKKHGIKTIAIIPDLLRDMYINESLKSPITKLKQLYLKPSLKKQGDYSGYVYLTDSMHQVVAPDKPYIVVEGIADVRVHKEVLRKKTFPCAVMYAGMLHEKYGIINLLDAFEQASLGTTELWLFGEGTAVEEIKRRSQCNSKIRYFGPRSREEVLQYEQIATLLINPRDPGETFTQYSFPSKTIEYMLSGTPLLTTRLPGIPKEYYPFVYLANDNSVETLASSLQEIFSKSDDELRKIGEKARMFILREKNAKKQTEKILKFMQEV